MPTCSNEACSSDNAAWASASCCWDSSSSAFLACDKAQHSRAYVTHVIVSHCDLKASEALSVKSAMYYTSE